VRGLGRAPNGLNGNILRVFDRIAAPRDAIVQTPALTEFAREIAPPERDINLARAALAMVRYADPDVNIAHYLARLDQLAAAATGADAAALAEYLFGQLGYSGNQHKYNDARNSYLQHVIDRRLGIPITLSVLFIEVARRRNLRAFGVGLPGHFIVGVRDASVPGGVLFLDPFHQGSVLSHDDCRARVERSGTPFDRVYLAPVGARYILTRMLHNLKSAHAQAGDVAATAHAVERLLLLQPNDAAEARNLGVLYAQNERKTQALQLLSWYVDHQPAADDRDEVRAYARALAESMTRWN
jgi:regulator of sirC expression with transglutaminase-like and TPR domain